jgi:hypothetical protein
MRVFIICAVLNVVHSSVLEGGRFADALFEDEEEFDFGSLIEAQTVMIEGLVNRAEERSQGIWWTPAPQPADVSFDDYIDAQTESYFGYLSSTGLLDLFFVDEVEPEDQMASLRADVVRIVARHSSTSTTTVSI